MSGDKLSPIKTDEVQELVNRGKKQGELSYEEIMDKLEDLDLETDDIDRIYDVFRERDIDIVEDDDDEVEEELDEDEELDLSISQAA